MEKKIRSYKEIFGISKKELMLSKEWGLLLF